MQELQALIDDSPSDDLAEVLADLQAARDGVRPTGVWTGAPATAASTVAMTNTTKWPVEVLFSGGTWTVLKKNNVTQVGVTSANQGTVPTKLTLNPGATWALTYSVVPTSVVWTYA